MDTALCIQLQPFQTNVFMLTYCPNSTVRAQRSQIVLLNHVLSAVRWYLVVVCSLVDKSSLAVSAIPNWGIFCLIDQSEGQNLQFYYTTFKKPGVKSVKTYPKCFSINIITRYFSKNLPRTFSRSLPVQEISRFDHEATFTYLPVDIY